MTCSRTAQTPNDPLGGFDPDWYLETYPDVSKLGMSPLEHYLTIGMLLGRQPGPHRPGTSVEADPKPDPTDNASPRDEVVILAEMDLIRQSGLFDETFYHNTYHDVGARGMSGLDHYCRFGWQEGRFPNPAFNTAYYREKYPDVVASGMNPLVHWIQFGRGERRFINRVEVESTPPYDDDHPAIIFISHEASQTGAPAVLLSLMHWLKKNTDIAFSIVIGSSGPWNYRFEALAPCFYIHGDHHEDLDADLRRFCGNQVQLVYVNTIASGYYASLLAFLGVPYITHVHELESLFRLFVNEVEQLKTLDSRFIAVSDSSAQALLHHAVTTPEKITVIYPFIDPAQPLTTTEPLRPNRRLFGCGAVEQRKGFDLFCELARELRLRGRRDCTLYWIGAAEGKDLDPLREIQERGVSDMVVWLGPKPYPRDYFVQGDIFVLPSREDPFPLVCLEAADCGIPVVCFDDRAGGMASFVGQDAGVVTPYLDMATMAAAVAALLDNEPLRHHLGSNAMRKVREFHYADAVLPRILSLLPPLASRRGMSEESIARVRIDAAAVVSFDIFDTLVTRLVDDPKVVFDLVEYRLTQNDAAPIAFFEERMATAGEVLRRYGGRLQDVTIDEIYQSLPFFQDITVEKSTEIAICVPHSPGIALYRYALAQGKRICLTSDMYLDQGTVESILRENGVTTWDALLLSSSLGHKKDTGALYNHLLALAAQWSVPPAGVLHIGDNWNGDIRMARQANIEALRVSPLAERGRRLFRLAPAVKAGLSQSGRIWDSVCGQLANLWHEEQPELAADFFTTLGFEIVGPLATMMAMFVKSEADRLGVHNIWFLARDGRIIKRAFDVLYRPEIEAGTFRSAYVHLARATVIPATLGNPLSANDLYFLIEGLHFQQKNLRFFLEKAGLESEDAAVLEVVGYFFDSPDVVPGWNDRKALCSMFVALAESIHEANAPRRAALRRYLEDMGLLTQEKGIVVDVGWLLNIQSRLEHFLRNQGIVPDLTGCYVGSRERISKKLAHACLMFSCGDPHEVSQIFEGNTTLFEVLFSAPESSAKDLRLDLATGEACVEFESLSTPPVEEYSVAQNIHLGATAFFKMVDTARREAFFPDQLSRDYFLAQFNALVTTSNPLAKAKLGHFSVRVGGHHEFESSTPLLKEHGRNEFTVKPRDERFEPLCTIAENSGAGRLVIVTSAGLDNGSTRYRSLHLSESLARWGVDSVLLHSATDMETARESILAADGVLFQRCFEAQGNVKAFLAMAREADKACLGDMDDLVFPDFLGVIGSVAGGEWNVHEATFVATAYTEFLEKLDACLVSTPRLADYIKRRFAIPTAVARNKIDTRRIVPRSKRSEGPPRLLYASGTASHKDDFARIEKILYDFLRDHPEVHLTVLGNAQVTGRILSLPTVSNLPMLPYKPMLSCLAEHDLLLVPLKDNCFNHGKSAVKFVEAGAVGVTVLASPLEEFARAIRPGENGLLADSTAQWRDALEWAVRQPEELAQLGKEARETVCRDFDIGCLEPDVRSLLKSTFVTKGRRPRRKSNRSGG